MRDDVTTNFAGGRLLLCDDDMVLREMAAKTLRHAGFDVVATDTGEEALQLFNGDQFDLVLLDVMMPGLDGFQVCARLRELPGGETLPILMLTGLNDTESVEAAFRCGATDFVTKPINWTLLSHRVRYSLRASAAAESLARGRESLARAQEIANLGSWEWLPEQDELICSDELVRIFAGAGPADPMSTPGAFLNRLCAADRNKVRAARDATAVSGEAYKFEYTIERLDGEKRTLFEHALAVKDGHGKVVKIEGITQDISDRVEAERRIHELAFYDSTTGLPNRSFFNEMARPALERARRLRKFCAVLYLDLDRFKSVNDAFGQNDGDELLRVVASRLQESVRKSDLTTSGSLKDATEIVARVGGNSFIIMLVDIRSSDDAALVASRLLDAVAQPMLHRGREALITASTGIAVSPRDADSVLDLTQKAEQALYAAKAAGRATYRFFDEEMNAAASKKLALGSDLRRAIGGDELRLYLQPKVDARNAAIIGAEGLVRWQHPQCGLLAPYDFIPLAEELGLIVPLGEWVLETACRTLRNWRHAGMTTVPLSINLSSVSFMRSGMVEHLDELVKRFGIDPQQLILEVTESVLMNDTEQAISRMHRLRERGFELSLDDFGTGFSSLSYLKTFPIDEMKIDRSFVRDVTKDTRDAALVGSIIALGEEFSVRVVAEGVEDEAQAKFLLKRGCRIQQGYLFGRPMPIEEFAQLLSASSNLSIAGSAPTASA